MEMDLIVVSQARVASQARKDNSPTMASSIPMEIDLLGLTDLKKVVFLARTNNQAKMTSRARR